MDWIKIISIILLFFLWAYILYRWMKAEKELEAKDLTIATLRDNRSSLKEEVKKYQRDLILSREESRISVLKNECDLEYQTDTIGKYIVEVNKGSYLMECKRDTYEYWKKHGFFPPVIFTCTEDAFKATRYKEWQAAKERAEKCGGRVLQHKPNLEVVE